MTSIWRQTNLIYIGLFITRIFPNKRYIKLITSVRVCTKGWTNALQTRFCVEDNCVILNLSMRSCNVKYTHILETKIVHLLQLLAPQLQPPPTTTKYYYYYYNLWHDYLIHIPTCVLLKIEMACIHTFLFYWDKNNTY